MGFLVTTLIFAVIGVIASLCTRICCNRGPSANLFKLGTYSKSNLNGKTSNALHEFSAKLLKFGLTKVAGEAGKQAESQVLPEHLH